MDRNPLITVYTQAYNTQHYIQQCIESVLHQTYTNIQYLLVDNGCTDHSWDIMNRFAETDSRIQIVRYGENHAVPRVELLKKYARGLYYTVLDSDDWWELNYLERMLSFLESNHLDMALTGTKLYIEADKTEPILRKLDVPICMSLKQFSAHYPQYWAYPSTLWASLIPIKLLYEVDVSDINNKKMAYGSDTITMLRYLTRCSHIGIDNTALYHYRIRKNSVSYEYNLRRFAANLEYCDDIRAFLVNQHTFDAQKREWLKRVYLSSITESVRLALGAQNTLHEKLAVCGEIAAHPQTADALQSSCNERKIFLDMLRQIVPMGIRQGTEEDFGQLLSILQRVCPQCGAHASRELLKLCQRAEALLPVLLNDDLTALALAISNLISQGRYTKQFDLPEILAGLLPDNPISTVRDAKFYKNYASLCTDVIKGNTLEALDGMTEVLMNHQIPYGEGEYLQLYLTLAALEQQVPAFLFGKVQLAQFYLKQKNYTACRGILGELDEMGMEEQEDVEKIKTALKEKELAT